MGDRLAANLYRQTALPETVDLRAGSRGIRHHGKDRPLDRLYVVRRADASQSVAPSALGFQLIFSHLPSVR
jgi:hypothetical protein